MTMRIGGFELGERPLVVAELGNNHEGDPGVARELIGRRCRRRRPCGQAADLPGRRASCAPRTSAASSSSRGFELAPGDVESLAQLARELGVLFISTPLDLGSAELLEPLVDAYKVASGDNDFLPLLDRLADSDRPLIVSTGLLDLDGVRGVKARIEARRAERGAGADLAFLHAVTAYPCPPEQVNLAAIPMLARELGCPIGYSDHTLGIEACVLAATLGAAILEKHVTLAHDFSDFRDHQLSATPDELRELVAAVGRAQVAGADRAAKEVQPAEEQLHDAVRRAIVAARDLPAGTTLAEADLTWMRPRDGLAPGQRGRAGGPAARPRRRPRRGDPGGAPGVSRVARRELPPVRLRAARDGVPLRASRRRGRPPSPCARASATSASTGAARRAGTSWRSTTSTSTGSTRGSTWTRPTPATGCARPSSESWACRPSARTTCSGWSASSASGRIGAARREPRCSTWAAGSACSRPG